MLRYFLSRCGGETKQEYERRIRDLRSLYPDANSVPGLRGVFLVVSGVYIAYISNRDLGGKDGR